MIAPIECEVYYQQGGVVVRASQFNDILYLKRFLRQSDRDEIFASNHHTPEEALLTGFRESTLCLTLLNGGIPVMMFGVNVKSLCSESGIIWLLATDEVKKIRIRFIRNCQYFINLFLDIYPFLWNYCDARNTESLAWLRYCGATIAPSAPYGVEGRYFHYFYFKK